MSSFFVSSKQLNLTALATSLDGNLNLGVYVKVEDVVITNIKTLKEAQPNSLSFYNNYKYLEDLFKSKTGVCLIEQNTLDDLKQQYLDKIKHITFLVVKNAYLSFAKAGNIFYADTVKTSFISPLAFIDKTAKIGDNVSIKEFAVIGANVIIADGVFVGSNSNIHENVEIAENTVIHSNVSIKYSKIGKNCIIHDGVRIGQDGFGFAPNPTGHIKILQIGGVIIEDNVEIGANTTIDRGALENTEIGFGTKIDNLVQIAHGVKIGKHCFIAAQVGIAGSAVLEDLVFVGGGTGISPHITIEKGKQIVPQSGVMDDIKGEPILMGYPAIGKADFFKTQVLLKRLLKEYKNKKQ